MPIRNNASIHVLVVEDDLALRSVIVDYLEDAGCLVFEASDGGASHLPVQTGSVDRRCLHRRASAQLVDRVGRRRSRPV